MGSLATEQKTIHVLMFPWLAHGHISPYLELAKRLTKRDFIIHLCSTPANLSSIKHKIGEKFALSIRLVELHLPSLPNLPPCYHTTNGLPPDLMPTLKLAFDMAKPNFFRILASVKPNLLIYDFLQPWAPLAASRYKIPAVEFITSSSTMTAYMFHFFMKPKVEFPFETICYRDYELVHQAKLLAPDERVRREAFEGVRRSNRIVLIKGFREIELKYSDYLSTLLGKKIMPVGPLVQNPSQEVGSSEIIEWLDKKGKRSTVFVSFGSEYFLKQEEMEELAHGLELSNVNFIWVVRFPKGKKLTLKEALPLGFLDRVGQRGMVVEGWAPQAQILGHESIGGFVSHCGCSSMMESMKFGVPIIAMPMHLDQPLNARLVVEIGVGDEVLRNNSGRLEKEEVAAVIHRVVAVGGRGEVVRKNARAMSEKMMAKGDEEIDEVVKELLMICSSKKKKRNGLFH
ncbi:UNVERIFIED_CONTAM: Beta-D-glucosyl crocetin beta-1,6-glucosyltransferase [Sesamum calycinum]|uniref:Glycosyltransferase n=1 Tax=Sesamum calycinum TaxID=2727403 RepID=A0AAW2SYR8_9LAMI